MDEAPTQLSSPASPASQSPPAPPAPTTGSGGEVLTPWSPRLTISRRQIRALADRICREDIAVDPYLHRLFDERGPEEAALFALAAIVAKRPPDAREVVRILPTVRDEDVMVPALAYHAGGDRLAALLDLVEGNTMYYSRSFMCLYLIFELLGEERPPRLYSILRLYARLSSRDALLGEMISRVSDPAVRRIGAAHLRWVPQCSAWISKTKERISQLMKDPLSFLPEQEQRTLCGFTVTRPRSIGRNDPCPCNSGKKYKKCCQRRDEENPPEPSPVPGLDRAAYRARIHEFLTPDQFAELNLCEMLESPVDRLPILHQAVVLRECAMWGHWDHAEKILSVIDSPGADPEEVELVRRGLVQDAAAARQVELLNRQIPLLKHPNQVNLDTVINVNLLLPSEQTMPLLESLLLVGLQSPSHQQLWTIAGRVAEYYPALGILLCRGSLVPLGNESIKLLQNIEEARDRLNLPPEDIYAKVCTLIKDNTRAERLKQEAEEQLKQEGGRLRAKEAEADERVRKAEAQVEELSRRLRRTEEELAAARAAAREGVEQQEYERLQRKVERLKDLLRQSHAERASLHKALAALSEAGKTAPPAAGPPVGPAGSPGVDPAAEARRGAAARAEPDEEEEAEAAPEVPRRQILPPTLSRQVQQSLIELPARVSQEALLSMARLSGGDPVAWGESKRLTGTALWSIRVANRYRLLFRPAERSLSFLDLRHRRYLEIGKRQVRGHIPEDTPFRGPG